MKRFSSSQSLLREGRQTLVLAVPLIVGQVSQMLMGVVDTVMIGRVGVTELAASAFSNNLIYVPMMFGIGMSIVVSIRVSQARGAKDPAAARAALRHGLQITSVLGLLTLLGAWLLRPHLWVFRQVPEVLDVCSNYFLLVAGSMVPAMMSMAVKNHADAMNRPWPVFWITLGSVLLNAGLNWVFIFGKMGAPVMGLDGAGVATLLARTAGVVSLIWWSLKFSGMREWVPYHWFKSPDWRAVREFIRLGIPASLQLLAEVSAFVFAGIFIGTLGEGALAAHQVAISYAATVFMVPLGISMAMTVRVGEVSGAGERARLRSIIVSGWLIGVGFSMLSVSVTLLFNDQIAGWFVEDPKVTQMAAGLLLVGAAFQFSDSFQVISAGSLRGLDDVKVPAWMAFCAYWLIAIPLGWTLAIPGGWGVNGVWWGLTLGLTLTAVALAVRVWRKTRVQVT